MYADYKKRRAVTRGIQMMELRQEKYVDTEALKRFREVPFQLKYARKLKGGGKNDGKLEKT